MTDDTTSAPKGRSPYRAGPAPTSVCRRTSGRRLGSRTTTSRTEERSDSVRTAPAPTGCIGTLPSVWTGDDRPDKLMHKYAKGVDVCDRGPDRTQHAFEYEDWHARRTLQLLARYPSTPLPQTI